MNPQARLGAFVLISLLLLFFATGKISEGSWFKPQGTIVETEFDDLLGLDVESPVRMAGVKVGIVQDIFLRNNRAVVSIALKPGVKLPGSVRATIISRGLVGEKNLALAVTPGDTTLLPAGTIIPSDPSGDINTFIAKASDITDDIKALTKAFSDLSGDKSGGASLQQLISNFNRTSEKLNAMLDRYRTDLDKAAASLPKTIEAGRAFFVDGKELTDNLNATVVDNRENLYRILFELRKTSENLQAFSDDIRRNPWKVLSEKPEVKALPKAERAKMEEMILTTGHMGPAPADR